ncbi:hypothetical protein ACFQ10_27255 [Streptomyces indonesiensis]
MLVSEVAELPPGQALDVGCWMPSRPGAHCCSPRRSEPAPAGTHHTHDTVLRARRLR